jgi:hypothetical protein
MKEPTDVKATLPSNTFPSIEQQVIGRQSRHHLDIEEFRGIPYGVVLRRWQSSKLRSRLPTDVFDATRNGYDFPRQRCQPYYC